MKTYNLYKYYRFGYNYRLLRSADDISNKELARSLSEYLKFITAEGLVVTGSGVRLKNLDKLYEKLKKISEDSSTSDLPTDSDLNHKIKEKLEEIDHILDAELSIKTGFALDEKRYPNEILTKDIHRIFAVNVFGVLPPIAIEDFKEAGLCLAFDRYTAAAFHSLRGTEDVLKYYYMKILGKTPGGTATWGSCLNAINESVRTKNIKPAPSQELMINLENLRKYHRNKTQHPVRTYSSDEAQDLLGTCVATINEIVKDLQQRGMIEKT